MDRQNVNAESQKKSGLSQELIERALKNKQGTEDLDIEGKKYSISFGYILEKDWVYAVAISKESYLKPVYALQKAVIASGVISILIALLLSMIGTKGMIMTIMDLNRAVAKADQGDLTVRANCKVWRRTLI